MDDTQMLLWKKDTFLTRRACHSLDTMLLTQPPTMTLLAASVDTLDFSLPSYSDATKGGDLSKAKAGAGIPSFNPFGDFEPQVKDDTKAEAKAAAEAKKAEDKAAAEAKKAQDKAAKEADKAARRASELEKQKAAVQRSKQTEAPAAPAEPLTMPEFKAPDFSDFKAPDIKVPDLKVPEFKAPEMPAFTAPNLKLPDMPKFSMPKLDLPKIDSADIPKFDAPKLDMPKLDMPKMDLPKVSLPKVSLPQISLPSFGGGGGTSSSDDAMLEPQEVRDEAAREARQVYLTFDEDAKVIERQAREARNLANEKKKLANEAKDQACQTRPGGKWICLRNPFTAGF